MYFVSMTKTHAYDLFDHMITTASDLLFEVTTKTALHTQKKPDLSLVTQCDTAIDTRLSHIAREAGLSVISEEGQHTKDVVASGNYITIDPIDGTKGYIAYVEHAIVHGGIATFLQNDLGPRYDFSVLLGIVENGKPAYGALYNYITKEKILIDAQHKENFVREHNIRNYHEQFAVYIGNNPKPALMHSLAIDTDITFITQATTGLKSLYTIINPHDAAVMITGSQQLGLWDILPAVAAASVFGGELYDGFGERIKLTDYVMVPGIGVLVIKGEKFKYLIDSDNSLQLK